MDFNDKIAVVTGSSKGIGLSIKNFFEAKGSIVFGISRSAQDVKNHIVCDIKSEKEIKNSINKILLKHKKIDFLINNAGIFSKLNLSESTLHSWNDMIDTNLTSAFLMCKNVIPSMKKQKYGKIVNISSIAARNYSAKGSAGYTVSKYGLIGLTKQLSFEYAKNNININCVCPSQTNTDMLLKNLTTNEIENMKKNIPSRSIAEPDQIAEVVAFLCSESSSYMFGSILDVNGGQI